MSTTLHSNNRFNANALAGLMPLQMVLGILLNFVFLRPILGYDGSTSNEELSFILGCATLAALFISSINIAFGLLLPKDKTQEYFRTFVFLIVFAAAGLTLCAHEYAQLGETITFLTSPAAADPNAEVFRKILASGRNEAHFLSIFISSCSLAIFYLLLIRAQLIHAWLAYFALGAALLQLVAIGHTFFQASIPNVLQLPLLITQLLVPVYLLVKGFRQT
jgi:hypothetical protein